MNSVEWSTQYDFLKRRIQNLRLHKSDFTAEDIRQLGATLNNLDSQLRLMSEQPARYELCPSEVSRRQLTMEYLKKQWMEAKDSKSSLIGAPSVGGYFGVSAPSSASGGGVGGGGGQGGRTEYNPMTTTDRGLVQRQKDVMRQQDEMVLELERGLTDIHKVAVNIGEETKVHSRLLDDLDSNVDIATAALQAEAKHANEIKEKAQVCWMYICIAVEVIVLFLLIILTVMH